MNLALADMLYAIFITPATFLGLTSTHPDGTGGTVLCKLVTGGGLAWIAGISSGVTLIAIAVERYYAVIYPAGNIGKLNKRKLKVRQSVIISSLEWWFTKKRVFSMEKKNESVY